MKHYHKALFSTLIVLLSSLLSLNANADRPSYNYISIEYANRNIDNVNVDLSGANYYEEDISFNEFGLAGSVDINDKWFVETRYSTMKGDQVDITTTMQASFFSQAPSGAATGSFETAVDTKAWQASGSIGYQVRQGEDYSTFIAIGIATIEVEISEYLEIVFRDAAGNIVPANPAIWRPFSQSGKAKDSGAIISAGHRVNLGGQLQLGIRIDSVLIDGSSNNLEAELLYRFTDSFALQVSTEISNEETQYSIGLRYMI